jgi:hypothetical protein
MNVFQILGNPPSPKKRIRGFLRTIYPVIFLSFLMILLLVIPVSGAEEWVKYWTSRDGNVLSYNRAIIRNGTNDRVQVWNKIVFSDQGREKYIRIVSDAGGLNKLSQGLYLSEIDCQKGMFQILSLTNHGADKKVLTNYLYFRTDWNDIVPGSSFDTLRKKVCK